MQITSPFSRWCEYFRNCFLLSFFSRYMEPLCMHLFWLVIKLWYEWLHVVSEKWIHINMLNTTLPSSKWKKRWFYYVIYLKCIAFLVKKNVMQITSPFSRWCEYFRNCFLLSFFSRYMEPLCMHLFWLVIKLWYEWLHVVSEKWIHINMLNTTLPSSTWKNVDFTYRWKLKRK